MIKFFYMFHSLFHVFRFIEFDISIGEMVKLPFCKQFEVHVGQSIQV